MVSSPKSRGMRWSLPRPMRVVALVDGPERADARPPDHDQKADHRILVEGIAHHLGPAPQGLRLAGAGRGRGRLDDGRCAGAQGLRAWARRPRSAWARAWRSWPRAPRGRRCRPAAGAQARRPRRPGGAAGGAAWRGSAAPGASWLLLSPRVISPERSSRLAAFKASRSDPRMRLGNEPLACPVVVRFSSFMVLSSLAGVSRAPQTGTLSNFNRVRPSSMMSPSASWAWASRSPLMRTPLPSVPLTSVMTNSSSAVCSITA